MTYERRTITGGVPATTLGSGIDSSTLTITIADATGWPTGSAGDFAVVIDRGTASEEKVLVDTRSGTTLTVVSGGRGIDGTAGVTHSSGAAIEHCLLARDVDEPNAHIADTGLDHHSQYLNTARHDVEARHTFGAALGTPGAGADISTAASAGSGSVPARSDHVHKIGTGAINSSGMFAAGVVDAAAIAADAVGASEIAAGAVGTSELANDAVTADKIAADAVGASEILAGAVGTAELAADAVTAAKIAAGAVDTSELAADAVTAAKIAAGAVTMAKFLGEASTAYVPSLTNVTLGTGGTRYGQYFQFGKLVVGVCGFTLGTGGSVTGSIEIGIPGTAASTAEWILAASGLDASAGARAAGMGIISASGTTGEAIGTFGAGTWNSTSPWTWAVNDKLRAVFLYEAA